MNGVYTTSTSGVYILNNITSQTTVYCVLNSDLPCASPQSISSSVLTISVQGYQYSTSTFYQVTGSVLPGAKNQEIIYGKIEGTASSLPGGWGVSVLSFTMANSNNSNITVAKLWYNTLNDFSTATLKDSIANPGGTINFNVSGVSDLTSASVYFFLTYDVASNGACGGNLLDALVPANGLTITGNIAGQKSVTTDANPTGNRTINSAWLTPSVSISANKTTVTSGSAATFTASSVNGGSAPSYSWYVNNVYTAITSGTYTLNNITGGVNVYCVMTSDLLCVSSPTATSNIHSIAITNAKYLQSRFYQVTGTVIPGAKNQQILWGQFDGGTTNNAGGWGIDQIKFTMVNSNNAAVTVARLYFNTVNDFSTAIVKDSVVNPSGIITFNISGVGNLDLDSYYFFLAFDISSGICAGNTFDASIPLNAISVIGNIAGKKTPVSGTNPTGNRSFSGSALVPSVSLTTSGTTTCSGYPVTFTPTPTNGGSNPVYEWFVNGASAGTTSGDFVVSNLTNQSQVNWRSFCNIPVIDW